MLCKDNGGMLQIHYTGVTSALHDVNAIKS